MWTPKGFRELGEEARIINNPDPVDRKPAGACPVAAADRLIATPKKESDAIARDRSIAVLKSSLPLVSDF
jgi:hypothetical protein